MFILSLNWLGRQCPTTRWLSGIPSDGLQPGKMSRHHFPIAARRPPPTKDRWLFSWFEHRETSDRGQHVALSQRFTSRVCPLVRFTLRWLVVAALGLVCFAPPSQAQERNKVLSSLSSGCSGVSGATCPNGQDFSASRSAEDQQRSDQSAPCRRSRQAQSSVRPTQILVVAYEDASSTSACVR
jgi:hypothetical protein